MYNSNHLNTLSPNSTTQQLIGKEEKQLTLLNDITSEKATNLSDSAITKKSNREGLQLNYIFKIWALLKKN